MRLCILTSEGSLVARPLSRMPSASQKPLECWLTSIPWKSLPANLQRVSWFWETWLILLRRGCWGNKQGKVCPPVSRIAFTSACKTAYISTSESSARPPSWISKSIRGGPRFWDDHNVQSYQHLMWFMFHRYEHFLCLSLQWTWQKLPKSSIF